MQFLNLTHDYYILCQLRVTSLKNALIKIGGISHHALNQPGIVGAAASRWKHRVPLKECCMQ